MIKIGYSIPEVYWGNDFVRLAKKFNFLSTQDVDNTIPPDIKNYIIIHHRYDASNENIFKILSILPITLPKIIFTNNSIALAENFRGLPFVFYTENLKTYSSLLADTRCKLLISEWSGAGQIAQYTLGSQGGIWYYYDHYPDIFNFVKTHKIWEHNSKLGSYFNCWDFKCVSGCDIQHFSSFDNLLNAIRQINYNK